MKSIIRFNPLVLKLGTGSERLMIWMLDEPLAYGRVAPANESLAYAFRAPRTRSEPEKLTIPLPGTFLRAGRTRAAAVTLTRCEFEHHSVGRLLGGLKTPPAKDAWRNREGR